MGSQFAPENLGVFDSGGIPEIIVDGIGGYVRKNGIYRFVFYSEQPVLLTQPDTEVPAEARREVVAKLSCSDQALRKMLRQVTAIVMGVATTTLEQAPLWM